MGKCIDKEESDWYNHKNGSTKFNNAIRTLKALKRYEYLIPKDKHFLYHNLRNGFAHSLIPNGRLALASPGDVDSNRMPLEHLKVVLNEQGKECVILRCDELYKDFSEACREVIEEWTFNSDNKMNKPILAHNYN